MSVDCCTIIHIIRHPNQCQSQVDCYLNQRRLECLFGCRPSIHHPMAPYQCHSHLDFIGAEVVVEQRGPKPCYYSKKFKS
uniref:Uncharacterized protein n=1 Tax=Setaria italica TaxID=4555 RepID=K4AHG8_SETIT